MNLFKNNVGKVDRIIRVVLGILLIANVFYALQNPIGWIGVVLIITGAMATHRNMKGRKKHTMTNSIAE